MEAGKFEKDYHVHVYETGPDGKLTLQALFNYLQDIASDHAEKLGYGREDLMRDNRFWVLSRIYAEIVRMPVWEDNLKIRTWPNGTEKIFALRNYEVFLPGGEIAVKATSSWLILDSNTRKIQRPDYLKGASLHETAEGPVRNPVKLEEGVEQGDKQVCFSIKAGDLDINLHANNAVYLRWIHDSYDLGFLLENEPQSVEINYIAEAKYGEEIIVRTKAIGTGCFIHSIARKEDDKELCRMMLSWKGLI